MDKQKLLEFIQQLKQQSQNLFNSVGELLDWNLDLLDLETPHQDKPILELKDKDIILAQNLYSNMIMLNKIIIDLHNLIEEKEKEK